MTKSGTRPNAVVVGAGFTGLATAYYLERAGYGVEVYERAGRVGGLISTRTTEYGPSESAANAFLNSARVEALFEDLGIPVVPAQKESRARFIFRGGRPRQLPLGFGACWRLAWFLFRFLVRRGSLAPRPGESLADWGRRIIGEEATEYLLLPGFQGIYSGEGRRLSATLLLQGVFSPRRGPKPKVRGSVGAPGGMGEVVEKLRARLESRGVRFHLQTEGPATVDHLTYFCGSAEQTARSLSRIAPDLSRLLSRIEIIPLVSATVFFKANPALRRGFGVLFPPLERFKSLGVLFNHAIFPGRVSSPNYHSETWILGGARRPEITGLSDEQILKDILADRKRVHAFEGEGELPVHYLFHRWVKSIPYYTVELEGVLGEISRWRDASGKIRIMGNYLGGIGLTKILERIGDEIEGEPRA